MSVDDSHKPPAVLDGDIVFACHNSGFTFSEAFEKWALNNEEKVSAAMSELIQAGSDIISTPTATANSLMLERHGMADDCEEINRKLLEITVAAVRKSGKALKIAGKIGPTGATVEPFGENSFTELISAYDKQVKILEEDVDLFLIENVTSVWDMRAAVISCKKAEKPVLITVAVDEDGLTVQHRVPAKAALIMLQEMGIDGFGACCDTTKICTKIIDELLPYAKVPLIAKTASSEEPSELVELIKSGVDYVGAFELNTVTELSLLSKDNFTTKNEVEKEDTSFIFTYDGQIYFLEPDTTEISEAVECLPEMEDAITEACKQSVDILRVRINTADDAFDFARNAHMATIPVMFTSHNELALKMALMLYQGRALIDSDTSISQEELKDIAEKYGAVIY